MNISVQIVPGYFEAEYVTYCLENVESLCAKAEKAMRNQEPSLDILQEARSNQAKAAVIALAVFKKNPELVQTSQIAMLLEGYKILNATIDRFSNLD